MQQERKRRPLTFKHDLLIPSRSGGQGFVPVECLLQLLPNDLSRRNIDHVELVVDHTGRLSRDLGQARPHAPQVVGTAGEAGAVLEEEHHRDVAQVGWVLPPVEQSLAKR